MSGMGGMGMMGGWGGGMMGPGFGALDLTRDQRNKMVAIHRDLRGKQFALMDRMHDNMESVRFYRDGKFVTYRLVLETPGLQDRRFTWIGRPVEVQGTPGEDGKGPFLRVQSLTGTTWESLGFPTGPPAR